MTNGSSSDRLDRIERLFEALGQRVDSNAKAIAANSAAIAEVRETIAEVRDTLSEAAGRTLRAVDELREIVEEDVVNFQEYRQRNDANVASINAAVERLEAILTQMRRERGGER